MTTHPFDQAQDKRFKLGDAISKVAKFLRIPQCAGCERRRVILNDIQSAGLKETIKRLKDCCN
jgi:hypothetical protein